MRFVGNWIVVVIALLVPALPFGPAAAGSGDRAAQPGEYRAITFYVA